MSRDQRTAAIDKQGGVKLKSAAPAYTFSKDGFPIIRKALICFGIVMLVSLALVAGSRFLLLRIEPERAKAQATQNAASEKFRQAESERIEIRDFEPKFTQLRARGFYGEENRLSMLELIKSIQENRHLLPISYEFAPQQLIPLDPTLLASPLELHVTRITLQLGLLHELDLFHFLHDLRDRGFYTTRECTITPAAITTVDLLVPHLNAECALYWVTVGEPAANATTAPPP